MRKALLLFIFIILLILPVFADFEETYADWVGTFGLDPNAGRSSFLVLIIPSGGKYEAMGTAYTAMTEDLGFLDANPAASSYLDYSELMVMHNDWISSSNLESFAYTQRFGDLGVGAAAKLIWLSFEETNAWGRTISEGAYTESVLTMNASYNFFQNYYFDGLSFGLNLKTAYRGVSSQLATHQNALALMGDFGVLTRFNFLKPYASRDRNFGVGITVKNLGQEFIDEPDPLPTALTAGFSYSPLRILTFAVDLTQPFYLNGESSEQFSCAVGMDFNAASFLSIQGGFLIKTGKPRLTMGSSFSVNQFTIFTNYTLDLTTQFKPVDRMSISIRYNLGEQGKITVRDKVQELYLSGIEAYADGRYEEAIQLWKQCLELDEDFTPAAEMIETTQTSLDLEERMRDLQTVE